VRRVPFHTLAAPVVIAGVILYFWDSRGAPRTERTRSHAEQLPPEVEATNRRTAVKNHLARRAVIERQSLLEVAELFDQVNGEEGTKILMRPTLPGRSIREKLCRQVIAFVRIAEHNLQNEGHSSSEPLLSVAMQAELDRRLAAGEFPPEPGMQ
jgi:hypothetical protein